jgi:NAD(P)-dependent dehydrogenase (short-subunit alcohol dehydrogenase family)
MDERMQDRAVLVTGASRGMGRAIALELGRRGATVIVHYARAADEAAGVVSAIEASGGRAFAVGGDLGDPDVPARMAAQVDDSLRALGAEPFLHGLVSNAGAVVGGDIDTLTAADLDRAFAINARGPILLVQAFLPLLRRGSRVITVSASLTRYAVPTMLAQSAAKAALKDASRNLAATLGPRGITVVDVSPGTTRTDLAADYLAIPGEEEALAETIALGRVAEPEDVGDAVVALLGPDTRWNTGVSIDLSGGYRI